MTQLTIRNPRARKLAGEIAAITGESLTQTVITALRESIALAEKEKASLSALNNPGDAPKS
jgi:hypothetical protein